VTEQPATPAKTGHTEKIRSSVILEPCGFDDARRPSGRGRWPHVAAQDIRCACGSGPLAVRKATLASLLARAAPGLRFNEHLDEADGPLVFAHACKLGLEGIVSKRRVFGGDNDTIFL
jgi:hypothetical protein